MGKLEASPWGTRQVVEGAMNRRLQHDAGMVASQESGNLEAIKWANGLSLGGRVMIPVALLKVTRYRHHLVLRGGTQRSGGDRVKWRAAATAASAIGRW